MRLPGKTPLSGLQVLAECRKAAQPMADVTGESVIALYLNERAK